jgi:hypothetical protein
MHCVGRKWNFSVFSVGDTWTTRWPLRSQILHTNNRKSKRKCASWKLVSYSLLTTTHPHPIRCYMISSADNSNQITTKNIQENRWLNLLPIKLQCGRFLRESVCSWQGQSSVKRYFPPIRQFSYRPHHTSTTFHALWFHFRNKSGQQESLLTWIHSKFLTLAVSLLTSF